MFATEFLSSFEGHGQYKKSLGWPSGSSAVRSSNTSFLCVSWPALNVDTNAKLLRDIGCPDLRFEAAWSLTTGMWCLAELGPVALATERWRERAAVCRSRGRRVDGHWLYILGVGAQARCPLLEENKSSLPGPTGSVWAGRRLSQEKWTSFFGPLSFPSGCLPGFFFFPALLLPGCCGCSSLGLGLLGFWACRFSCLGVLFSFVFLCDLWSGSENPTSRGSDPRTGKFWSGTPCSGEAWRKSHCCDVWPALRLPRLFWDFGSLYQKASRRLSSWLLRQRHKVSVETLRRPAVAAVANPAVSWRRMMLVSSTACFFFSCAKRVWWSYTWCLPRTSSSAVRSLNTSSFVRLGTPLTVPFARCKSCSCVFRCDFGVASARD